MIKFCESMQRGVDVLNALNLLVEGEGGIDKEAFWVEAMANGREQGFSVRSSRMTASFGQLRGSDAIIVYLGSAYAFNMQGNHPQKDEDIESRCFDASEADKAARAIFERMLETNPIESAPVANEA